MTDNKIVETNFHIKNYEIGVSQKETIETFRKCFKSNKSSSNKFIGKIVYSIDEIKKSV